VAPLALRIPGTIAKKDFLAENSRAKYLVERGGLNGQLSVARRWEYHRAETLAEPQNIRARQAAGTVHVHPNGHFVYGANRAQATIEFQGRQVFRGGENSIVVYAINQSTAEPTPIQHIETQKIHPRTLRSEFPFDAGLYMLRVPIQ